mmetsp:Transcript_9010/g.15311  ORF Transcript_9010/g.15311 Transcript_9010/m.15311 type:complete len:226 (+) Transcript_9010:1514-2191(+)
MHAVHGLQVSSGNRLSTGCGKALRVNLCPSLRLSICGCMFSDVLVAQHAKNSISYGSMHFPCSARGISSASSVSLYDVACFPQMPACRLRCPEASLPSCVIGQRMRHDHLIGVKQPRRWVAINDAPCNCIDGVYPFACSSWCGPALILPQHPAWRHREKQDLCARPSSQHVLDASFQLYLEIYAVSTGKGSVPLPDMHSHHIEPLLSVRSDPLQHRATYGAPRNT